MKSASLINEWAPIEFVATNRRSKPLELPKDKINRAYKLDVTFTVTLGAGGGADPTYLADSPWAFIQEVEISLGGKAYRRLSGVALAEMAYIANGGKLPVYTQPSISGTGAYVFYMQLPIPCGAFERGHLLPDKSNLYTTGKETPTVRVLFGDENSIYTGGSRTYAFSAVDVRLIVEEPQIPENPELLRTIISDEFTWSAATTGALKQLDIDPQTYVRRITLLAYTSGVRSNAVLNRVDLLAGVKDVVWGLEFDKLQRMNENDLGFTMRTGVVVIDFDKSKRWGDLFDARALRDLRLKFDVDAPSTSKIVVIPEIVKRL